MEIQITKQDVEHKLENTLDRMEKIHLEVMLDMEDGDYLKFLSKIASDTYRKLKQNYNIPNINEWALIDRMLDNSDLTYEVDEFFPLPVYISSTDIKGDNIGVLVNKEGKIIEYFEGNEEATDETVEMVNNIFNPKGKDVWVWGSHGSDTVEKIKRNMLLPKGIFVSPSKEYASGYFGDERILFKVLVNINNLSMESEYDWKTIKPTAVKKMEIQ